MDWIEAVQYIKEIQESNRLVVFVGSGVSKNSDIPTWADLITAIAKKINYDNCDSCDSNNEDCPTSDCSIQYNFTRDQYLKIPEYFFQSDTSDNHSGYYSFIKEFLTTEKGPNAIDEMIFRILPHHIITTNYDSLLECTPGANTQLYTTIYRDADMLEHASDKYLLKMHGDLEHPETIILNESDYLDYEQAHPLMCTFIRSLLVNHTFVFVGYSLNDYNLNIIINWINYFCRLNDIKERPKNFLISTNKSDSFEINRLSSKSIYVVDISTIPEEIIKNAQVPKSLSSPAGKSLYTFLRCIENPNVLDIPENQISVLSHKIELLRSYRRVSIEDILHMNSWGYVERVGSSLMFYDTSSFTRIKKYISIENTNSVSKLSDMFLRAGIRHIYLNSSSDAIVFESSRPIFSEIFQLYLDNDYNTIAATLDSHDTTAERFYYSKLLYLDNDLNEIISTAEKGLPKGDYITLLLHKYRSLLGSITLFDHQSNRRNELNSILATLPQKYIPATHFLHKLINSISDNIMQMQDILNNQEKIYSPTNHSVFYGDDFTYLLKLQSYVYDYYFFIKGNYIPYDTFKETKDYFSFYIKAIFCTYMPGPDKSDSIFGLCWERKHYPISEIDLDIITKYITPEKLREIISLYSVQHLEIQEDVSILKKYANLCKSFEANTFTEWLKFIDNYNILLDLVQMSLEQRNLYLDIFCNMLIRICEKDSQASISMFEVFEHLASNNAILSNSVAVKNVVVFFLSSSLFKTLNDKHHRCLAKMVKHLNGKSDLNIQFCLQKLIEDSASDSEKLNRLHVFRGVLNCEPYAEFICQQCAHMNTSTLFDFIIDKTVPFTEKIYQHFLDAIEAEHQHRITMPGVRTFPDRLTANIDYCLLLRLCDFTFDIQKLKRYAQYSDTLTFIVDPDNYDYSKVDLSNYMWGNFIYSSTYQQYFIDHKHEIITDSLRDIFRCGSATEAQQKIVFGLLLADDELRNFPD